jgi:hypothetical protein
MQLLSFKFESVHWLSVFHSIWGDQLSHCTHTHTHTPQPIHMASFLNFDKKNEVEGKASHT